MKQNHLSDKGLSLSQAQSISNLCNQRAKEIERTITTINNHGSEFNYEGKTYPQRIPVPMPVNIVDALIEKANLHATQSFLMENIKAKEELLKAAQLMVLQRKESPKSPDFVPYDTKAMVNENWGWEQLSKEELSEYWRAEAYASHVGQFIHKNGKLDLLRNELNNIAPLDFISLEEGKKIPMVNKVHHTSDQLLKLHEELAATHREWEQKVNYYKAKVKNLTTLENARISEENARLRSEWNTRYALALDEYQVAYKKYENDHEALLQKFEENRHNLIKKIANYRIDVPKEYQSTIDFFMPKE